jgi:hypothetical protein
MDFDTNRPDAMPNQRPELQMYRRPELRIYGDIKTVTQATKTNPTFSDNATAPGQDKASK